MSHLLDNPIWNALITGNQQFAFGTGEVRYIKRDVGFFAGFNTYNEQNFAVLHSMLPKESSVILFTPNELQIPDNWSVILKKPLQQMVYEKEDRVEVNREKIVPLGDEHIPAMLQLTKLTNPGPFLERTIDFGNYEGIFEGNELAAMTGQRLQPGSYTEVSAVCTHPNHVGKGYAAKLILSQIQQIQALGRTPFLHVYPDNTPACRLYEKLGFYTRKQLYVYRLVKN